MAEPTPEQLAQIEHLLQQAQTLTEPDALVEVVQVDVPAWNAQFLRFGSTTAADTYSPRNPRHSLVKPVVDAAFENPSYPPSALTGVTGKYLVQQFWPALSRNPALFFLYAATDPDLAIVCQNLYGHTEASDSTSEGVETLISLMLGVTKRKPVEVAEGLLHALERLHERDAEAMPFVPPPPATRTRQGTISIPAWTKTLRDATQLPAVVPADYMRAAVLRLLIACMKDPATTQAQGLADTMARWLCGNFRLPHGTSPVQKGVAVLTRFLPSYVAFCSDLSTELAVPLPNHLLAPILSPGD